jgi:hypothetical protein
MLKITGMIAACGLITACGQPQSAALASDPGSQSSQVNLASLDTVDRALPPGWTAAIEAEPSHFHAQAGKVYFEFPGDPAGAQKNVLAYEIAPSIVGDIAFSFQLSINGDASACEVSLAQGAQGGRLTPSTRNISLTLAKTAGSHATASFACQSKERVWGWLIRPALTIKPH